MTAAHTKALDELEALVEALMTRADADYLQRQLERSARALRQAKPQWSPPIPWPDLEPELRAALREPVAEAPLAVPLPEGEKISQGDAEEMLKDAYAEGRADQRESDATNILLLLGLCDEAVAVGDGRINTTDVYSLVGYFGEEADRNIHQPSETK